MSESENPFAGMAVDGDESVKGITEEERAAQDKALSEALDTDGDGSVSEEELSDGLDAMAEMENTIEGEDLNDSLPEDNDNTDSDSDTTTNINTQSSEDEEETILVPTKESLSKLFPPSHDDANMSHQQDWSRHCIKFAEEYDLHFLGMSVKDGEPMFKGKK